MSTCVNRAGIRCTVVGVRYILCTHKVYNAQMAQTVVVRLIDDLDGGDAHHTVTFTLDSKSYEIDLSESNLEQLRSALKPYVEKARTVGKSSPARRGSTLFSRLSPDEKARFRAWAQLPDPRRIVDARVQSWIDAGKP